jgi:cell shape-determining protein MreC
MWIVVLVLVVVFLALAFIMIAFTYPEWLKKGGKALARAVKRVFGRPAGKK